MVLHCACRAKCWARLLVGLFMKAFWCSCAPRPDHCAWAVDIAHTHAWIKPDRFWNKTVRTGIRECLYFVAPPLPLIPLFGNAIAISRRSARAYFAFQDRSQPQGNSRWPKPSGSIYIMQFQSGIFRNYVLENTNEDPAHSRKPVCWSCAARCHLEWPILPLDSFWFRLEKFVSIRVPPDSLHFLFHVANQCKPHFM